VIKFINNKAAAIGLAYMEGQEVELNEKLELECITNGYAVKVEALEDLSNLPEGLPKRGQLIEAGINLSDLQKDLQENGGKEILKIKGIGEKALEEIQEFLQMDPAEAGDAIK
jgi:hypothetical protein